MSAGAHVLLLHPPDKVAGPSEEDLLCAANLAAYFSKARTGSAAGVYLGCLRLPLHVLLNWFTALF